MPTEQITLPAAYLLDGHGHAAACDSRQLAAWTPGDGLLWVHLNYTNPQHQDWLKNETGLDEIIIQALLAEETRPRTTVIGSGLLMALRGVNCSTGAEPDDLVAIRIWIDETRIITTRNRDLLSIADLISELDAGKGPRSAAGFLSELMDRLVRRIGDTVDRFEERVADLEEQVLESGRSLIRYELSNLRRQTITLRRYLAPQREALSRLIMEKIEWMDESSRLHLREVSDRLVRLIEDMDAARERASVTQEELQGHLSEQLNSRMYVLSLVAAVFLPLGFLTGLLGVNVAGIPGEDSAAAFWIFVAMLIGVVGLQVILFKWKRWL